MTLPNDPFLPADLSETSRHQDRTSPGNTTSGSAVKGKAVDELRHDSIQCAPLILSARACQDIRLAPRDRHSLREVQVECSLVAGEALLDGRHPSYLRGLVFQQVELGDDLPEVALADRQVLREGHAGRQSLDHHVDVGGKAVGCWAREDHSGAWVTDLLETHWGGDGKTVLTVGVRRPGTAEDGKGEQDREC